MFAGPLIVERVVVQSGASVASGFSRLACACVAVAFILVSQAGCVQRRMTIRSNPPGALVYIDNYEIGTTPCSTDFIYYGTREIRLVRDGYETLTVLQPIPAPWYQIFPIDFFAENVVPFEILDERALDFQLRPQVMAPTQDLLQRADQLRHGSRVEGFIPPAAWPGGPPVQPLPAPAPSPGVPELRLPQ
jgi:hypothetical protein